MKLAFLGLLGVVLCGCGGVGNPELIEHVPTVVEPDRTLYPCDVVTQWPNTQTLTDRDVADLLITLDKDNLICRDSMNAVFKFLDDAKAKAPQW
jgi:hypothetical protein